MAGAPEGAAMDDTRQEKYGKFEITPQVVVAGQLVTFELTYHVGEFGIDDGGSLMICVRDVSDGGALQSEHGDLPNYVSASTDGKASLRTCNNPKAYLRPWMRAFIVDVYDGYLSPGETIGLMIGDRKYGSPGYQAQTYCEETFEFKVLVDCFGTGRFTELKGQPINIKSGKPAKVVAVFPSGVEPMEKFGVTLRVEDKWGNLCRECDLSANLAGNDAISGLPDSVSIQGVGIGHIDGVSISRAGTYRVNLDSTGLLTETNPVECRARNADFRPYWGDFHGQSEETVGTNPIEDYMWYAKKASAIDFVGHQGNDFEISSEVWSKIRRSIKEGNEPGRFVTFLGYEWSGNTGSGGDRNVYYPDDEGEVLHSSHSSIDEKDGQPDYAHVNELFKELRKRKGITIAHVGGRYANLTYHDAIVEPCVEICSAWGYFEWFAEEALSRGYKIGFVGGSDDHTGRPGASYPGREFAVRGGLTCVLSRQLTREAIWEALSSRRCYATTGQRILLDVRSDGHFMGEDYRTDKFPEISIRATGTAQIERVELRRGLQTIHVWKKKPVMDRGIIRVSWGGARNRGRGKTALWDGSAILENGRIIEAEPYAFQSPAEELARKGDNGLEWKSSTAGNEEGFIIRIDENSETVLHFNTAHLQFKKQTRDITGGATFPCGGLDLHVNVERPPEPLGLNFTATFTDNEPMADSVNPYYVKVVQSDGAMAWSSPIYIDFKH